MKLIALRVTQKQYDAIKLLAFSNNRTIPQQIVYMLGVHDASPTMQSNPATDVVRVATPLQQTPVDPDLDDIDFGEE